MKFSIVIPVFNKYNFTKNCLNYMSQLPTETHEIIIIDNASTDETQKELSILNRSNLIYIRNNTNEFHSKGCNIGFTLATGNVIIFMNNDIRVNSDITNWTNNLIPYVENAIVSPTMGQLDNNLNFIRESNTELDGNSYLSGWFLASTKEIWKKLDINGKGQIFNERYPFYFNDTDLSFRARKQSIPLKLVSIPIVHFGKISAGQFSIPKLYNEAKKTFVNEWSKK